MTTNNRVYVLLAVLSSLPLWASEHGGINWWHLGSEYKDAPALGWLSLTFLIFVVFLGRTIKKPLALYLETRSKDIAQAIEEGQRAKLAAEAQLANYDQKLKSLGQEIEKLKALFMEQALLERQEKQRLAKEMEARIVKNTEDTIRANWARSKHHLAEEMIGLALSSAKKHVVENQREAMNQHLKKQLIAQLPSTAKEVH